MADKYLISDYRAVFCYGSYVKIYYMTEDGKPNPQQMSQFKSFLEDHLESKSDELLKHYGFAIVYPNGFVNCCYWDDHVLKSELFLLDGKKVKKIGLDECGFMSSYDCCIVLGEANRWLKCNIDRMSEDPFGLYAKSLVKQDESDLVWPVDSLNVDLKYIGEGNLSDNSPSFKVFSMSEIDHHGHLQGNLALDEIVEFVRSVGEDKELLSAIYYPDDNEINICYKDNNGNFFARIFKMSSNDESSVEIPVDKYGALCYKEAAFLAYCLGFCDMDFMVSG